jgi:integrase/recombinase XerD
MHLCFAGGLRVSELVGVLTENLSLQHGASVTVRGKGRKERCLPLWKETARDLRAWLSVQGRRFMYQSCSSTRSASR